MNTAKLTFRFANPSTIGVTVWREERRHPIWGDMIPEDHEIAWPVLRDASKQDDESLRIPYARIYEAAREACPGEDVIAWRVEVDGDANVAPESFAGHAAKGAAEKRAEEIRARLAKSDRVRGSWSVTVEPVRSGDEPHQMPYPQDFEVPRKPATRPMY